MKNVKVFKYFSVRDAHNITIHDIYHRFERNSMYNERNKYNIGAHCTPRMGFVSIRSFESYILSKRGI